MTLGICSITITYNPTLEEGILQRQLKSIVESKISPFLIDNNSNNIKQIEEMAAKVSPTITVLRLDYNYGIGKALNIGISKCLQRDKCDWILTLDQDSVIEKESLNALFDIISREKDLRADIYGLNYRTRRFNKEKTINNTGKDQYTDVVITSGMLANRMVYETIKYDENLFMYFVDTDFCIRATKFGFTIIQCFSASMEHHEGDRLVKGKNIFYVMKPSTIFFIGRNSVRVFIKHHKVLPILYSFQVVFENIIASYFVVGTLYNLLRGFFYGIIREISE